MNATTSPPRPPAAERPSSVSTPLQAPAGESCPLCGAPLRPEQEWCLRCGAAARTRLAAAPNWKPRIAALAVLIALSLGVLAAALVKLAGDSGASPATTIVTTAPAAASAPAIQAPAATAPAPTTPTTTPTTGATAPGAGTPRTSAPATSLPGSNGGSKASGQARKRQGGANLGGTGVNGTGLFGAKQLRELHELRERIQRGGAK